MKREESLEGIRLCSKQIVAYYKPSYNNRTLNQFTNLCEGMMGLQTVTLRLPNLLYQRIERRAYKMNRSIEDELVNVVTEALPSLEDLPADITDEMAQLTFLTNSELLQTAAMSVTPLESERMEELLFKQQREGLTAKEQQQVNGLLHRYDQIMLIRAQAMLLLKERGIEIPNLNYLGSKSA